MTGGFMEHGIDIGTALTVFGAAFAMWAWVVAWGVSIIRREVGDLKTTVLATEKAQQIHVTQTERRLTMLETEFAYLKAVLYGKRVDADTGTGSNR